MELDHQRNREPCLSPAAFVNQVQYSNILEGRFKQLQGKNLLIVWLFPGAGWINTYSGGFLNLLE